VQFHPTLCKATPIDGTKTIKNTFNSQNKLFLVEIELARVEIFEEIQ
jgi:hypothetical protein